jgi:hypothetical protein
MLAIPPLPWLHASASRSPVYHCLLTAACWIVDLLERTSHESCIDL